MNEELLLNENYSGHDKIAQRIKTLVFKNDDLIFSPRIHMMTELTESHKLSSDLLGGRKRYRKRGGQRDRE